MYRFCYDYEGVLVCDWTVGNMDMNVATDSVSFVTSDALRDDTETFIQFNGTTVNVVEGVRSCLTDRKVIAVTQ